MGDLSLFYRRLVTAGPEGPVESLLTALLVPLGWIYGLVGMLRALLYRTGLLSAYRAGVPVISVGNLSVGGTGKTPTVDFLVKHLIAGGRKVAVVSRGYGGSGGGEAVCVSAGTGPLVPPEICGDEPYLLASRNPGALVFIARRRREGVRLAVEDHGAEVIVLDDGFQHLAVERDLDLVLLDGKRPFGNGRVLPAGLLREAPRALGRGDLFLMTRCGPEPAADPRLPGPVLHSRHLLDEVAVTLSGEKVRLADLRGGRGVAFAGIADPGEFFNDLTEKGLRLQDRLFFADHAAYGAKEFERIDAASAGADFLITTEKDGVKLLGRSFDLPCYLVPLTLSFFERGELERALDDLFPIRSLYMAVSKELLEILACPQCKGEVELDRDGETIHCKGCRLAYPVRDGIPVMLIEEAQKLAD